MLHPRVPKLRRVAYAAPALPLAAIALLLNAFLPKLYTDSFGVNVGFVAAVTLAARVFDAVTDPLIGFLSDRTPGSFGRRRPWIVGAAVPLALSVLLVFAPQWAPDVAPMWWWAGGIFAVTLFWTAVTIPYEAHGASLSMDYDERTDLLGLREVFLLVGTVLAAASPAIVRALTGLGTGSADQPAVFVRVGSAWAVLALAFTWWCGFGVPEHRHHGLATVRLRQALREVWQNRSFRVLLVSYTVAAFGSHLPATMVLYYVQYVIGSPHGDLILLLYLLVAILALPLWVWFAHRTSKKTAWLWSIGGTAGIFIWAVFLGEGDLALFVPIVALTGACGGAVLALPHAMQADVIDEDELLSGERREGQYIGLWSIAKKVSAALGIGLGLGMLQLAGYVPDAVQPDAVRWALRITYIVIPCLSFAAALLLAVRYPLDRVRHREVRAAIDARNGS